MKQPGCFLLALAPLLLGGCVNFGDRTSTPAVVYYVLNDASTVAAAAAPLRTDLLKDSDPLRTKVRVESYGPTLLVLDTRTSGFYDTDQLIYSRSSATRGQYQFARWTERPGKRLADLMRDRLDRLGNFQVAAAGGFVRGDLMLDTELIEFYHDASSNPGRIQLQFRAELVDLKQRKLLGRRVFEAQAPLTSFDAAGAAQASDQAVGRVFDELAAWLAALK